MSVELTAAPEIRARVVSALASSPWDMAGMARYAVRTYAEGAVAHPLTTQVEGVADFDRQRYSAEAFFFDPSDGSRRGPLTFFVVDGVVYQLVSNGWALATPRPGEIGSPLPLPPLVGYAREGGVPTYAGDPAARRALVEGLVSGIEVVGSEELRGTATERYRVHVDVARARERVAPALLEEMERWGESPGTGFLDVWLEGDRLRQFTSLARPSTEPPIPLRLEQEYWDHDASRPVELPPGLPGARPR